MEVPATGRTGADKPPTSPFCLCSEIWDLCVCPRPSCQTAPLCSSWWVSCGVTPPPALQDQTKTVQRHTHGAAFVNRHPGAQNKQLKHAGICYFSENNELIKVMRDVKEKHVHRLKEFLRVGFPTWSVTRLRTSKPIFRSIRSRSASSCLLERMVRTTSSRRRSSSPSCRISLSPSSNRWANLRTTDKGGVLECTVHTETDKKN